MDEPLWWKLLQLPAEQYERSRYAAPLNEGSEGKFRLKNSEAVIRKLAPGVYEDCAGEVKEYQDALDATDPHARKYKIGRKLGSIPLIEFSLRPELSDPHEQDKYFQQHPELKTH